MKSSRWSPARPVFQRLAVVLAATALAWAQLSFTSLTDPSSKLELSEKEDARFILRPRK